jgi:hypothetical protein
MLPNSWNGNLSAKTKALKGDGVFRLISLPDTKNMKKTSRSKFAADASKPSVPSYLNLQKDSLDYLFRKTRLTTVTPTPVTVFHYREDDSQPSTLQRVMGANSKPQNRSDHPSLSLKVSSPRSTWDWNANEDAYEEDTVAVCTTRSSDNTEQAGASNFERDLERLAPFHGKYPFVHGLTWLKPLRKARVSSTFVLHTNKLSAKSEREGFPNQHHKQH